MSDPKILTLFDSYKQQETFDAAKRIFVYYQKYLNDNNKTVEHLLKVFSDENVLKTLSRKQFSEIINTLFYSEFKDNAWVNIYTEQLVNSISDAKGKIFTNGRAKRYSDYLIVYKQKVKKQKSELAKVKEEDLIDTAIDNLKFTLAIFKGISIQYHRGRLVEDMDFDISYDDVKRYVRCLINKDLYVDHEKQNPKPFPIHNPFEKKPVDNSESTEDESLNIKDRKKLFCIIMTWFLYFRICEEDGIEIGGAENA